MITRPRLHWFRMLLVWRGSVLNRILPQLCFITLLSMLISLAHGYIGFWKFTLTATPFTLMGVALAVFLGFRNSASYERYWEARKLWGVLLNESRNLARQVMTLTSCSMEDKRQMVLVLAAFAHALRHQLRGTNPTSDLARLLPEDVLKRVLSAQFKPAILLLVFSEQLAEVRRRNEVDPVLIPTFEKSLSGLSDALGGCERIANTLLPYTYVVIIHRTVYLYCFLLPFGLVDTVGISTPVIVAFIAYAFFSLEALSDEIEDPFGTQPNDLALESMSVMIESSLRETLGETELPEPVAADNHVLL